MFTSWAKSYAEYGKPVAVAVASAVGCLNAAAAATAAAAGVGYGALTLARAMEAPRKATAAETE